MSLSLEDFDYDLPPALIAQQPAAERRASRLLVMAGDRLEDTVFAELPRFLRRGDLLVMNDTRVIHARLTGVKDSGGRVEIMVERILGESEALAQIRASHKPRPGAGITIDGGLRLRVIERRGEFFRLAFPPGEAAAQLIERHGRLPLPPYITHAPQASDEERYQTVYARVPGSVAAPTAGLHFDEALLAQLRAQGIDLAWVTLHVGAGTFQPVRVADIGHHRMHSERYELPPETLTAVARARAAGGRVVAVGTTSMRTLEAAARGGDLRAGAGETDLFITPGFDFRVVDLLVTNFHLPRSTLLMLVAAFGGLEHVRRAYRHAVQRRYRFFSYGDAMLISRPEP